MGEPARLDREESRRWRSEADRALEGARPQADAGLRNRACFAAEQAARLAAKGLLHGLGRGPWGHDPVRLGYPDPHPSGPRSAARQRGNRLVVEAYERGVLVAGKLPA